MLSELRIVLYPNYKMFSKLSKAVRVVQIVECYLNCTMLSNAVRIVQIRPNYLMLFELSNIAELSKFVQSILTQLLARIDWNLPSRFVALANSLKSRPNILTGAGWIFLFLGNLTLRKKLVKRKPFLATGEEFSSLLGGLGNARDDFLGSVFNCTMWACFELGTAGNFRTGFRPTATRSIFTGCSYLMMDLGRKWGESFEVLLLWMPLSSVELSPLEDELDLKKS